MDGWDVLLAHELDGSWVSVGHDSFIEVLHINHHHFVRFRLFEAAPPSEVGAFCETYLSLF